jgi:hypothetical protein
MKFYISVFSEYLLRKFKFDYNLTTITGTSHEDRYTFVIISRSILLRMRNVSDKSCRENQNTHFVFSNFFPPENRAVYEIISGKYGVEPKRPQVTMQYDACALYAGYLRLQRHTQNMYHLLLLHGSNG